MYTTKSFYETACEHNLKVPRLRLVIGNRFRSQKGDAMKLYTAMKERMKSSIQIAIQSVPHLLYPLVDTKTKKEIERSGNNIHFYMAFVPEANSSGVFSSLTGHPFTMIRGGKVRARGQETTLQDSLLGIGWAIQDIVTQLHQLPTGFESYSRHLSILDTEKTVTAERPLPHPRVPLGCEIAFLCPVCQERIQDDDNDNVLCDGRPYRKKKNTDGKCNIDFHLKCVGLETPVNEDEPFYCKFCIEHGFDMEERPDDSMDGAITLNFVVLYSIQSYVLLLRGAEEGSSPPPS